MASYHLRVKNDTKSGGGKVSAKRHVDYILREDGKAHADYINREGSQSEKTDCVFKGSQLLSGLKTRHKDFSTPRLVTRTKGTFATEKSSCLCPMNWLLNRIAKLWTVLLLIMWQITITLTRYTKKRRVVGRTSSSRSYYVFQTNHRWCRKNERATCV